MKNLLAFCIMIISFSAIPSFATAQDQTAIEIIPRDQAYPTGSQPENATIAAFISVFDDTNVGNMHVFSTLNTLPKTDYYYTGTDITGSFNDILPAKMKRMARRTGEKIYAVRNIRGVNGEYYIMRVPGKRGEQQLKMYELQGTKLVELMTLATAHCKENGMCWQTDSWIQDVNGDTRLDIIQKKAKMRNGTAMKVRTTIYMQNRMGIFNKNSTVDIKEQNYMFEEMQ